MKKFLRIARTVHKTADATVGVIDHAQSKFKRLIIFIAFVIFALAASIIGLITGSISLFV